MKCPDNISFTKTGVTSVLLESVVGNVGVVFTFVLVGTFVLFSTATIMPFT